jgi:hypothetical protein
LPSLPLPLSRVFRRFAGKRRWRGGAFVVVEALLWLEVFGCCAVSVTKRVERRGRKTPPSRSMSSRLSAGIGPCFLFRTKSKVETVRNESELAPEVGVLTNSDFRTQCRPTNVSDFFQKLCSKILVSWLSLRQSHISPSKLSVQSIVSCPRWSFLFLLDIRHSDNFCPIRECLADIFFLLWCVLDVRVSCNSKKVFW